MPLRKERIRAVHEHYLEEFLQGLGLLEDLENGNVHCAICGDALELGNLQCIFPQGNEVKLCCQKTSCYEKAVARVGR